jgi:Phage integrase SAM-like domain
MGNKKAKANYRRTVLRLPHLDHSKTAVLNSLTSPGSRRVYKFAIEQITWYCSEPRLAFNRIVVVRYRMYLEGRGLAANTINQQLAVVRRLAYEAADAGVLSPELAAGISRVKGVKQLGFRSGNWLSVDQSTAVLNTQAAMGSVPGETMPCWPCCSAAGCADPSWWDWRFVKCKPGRGTGPLWT